MTAELVEDVRATLGEGPSLFPDGNLRWVDIPEGNVFTRTREGSLLTAHYDYDVAKVLPWEHGYLALTARGVELVNTDGHTVLVSDITEGDSTLRCSDGTVLPSGGVAVGVVDKNLVPGRGRLVVIQPDGSITTIVDNATIPNGIDVHPSHTSMWWVDSPTQTVMRFEVDPDTGLPHTPTPWATVPSDLGIPDGLCADREGGLWVALWGGGCIIHFDRRGIHDQTIPVPVSHVTAVAFDSDDTLVVTSGTAVLTDEEKTRTRGAGGLWAITARHHGTKGLSPRTARLAPHRFLPEQAGRKP